MPRSGVKEKKRHEAADSSSAAFGWKTVLFNCDCHTFHEVAIQLVKAIGCTYERGRQLANVVHYAGCAIVFSGPREQCEGVARVLEETGLKARAWKVRGMVWNDQIAGLVAAIGQKAFVGVGVHFNQAGYQKGPSPVPAER